MILKNRYDDIMENIKVTDEMHDRIMKKISNMDFDNNSKKVLKFSAYKKYISIAACFVFLLVGVITIPNIIKHNTEPQVQVVPDIVEYNSVNELSNAVGFTVQEINNLPFDVEKKTYIAYSKELAEIIYAGQDSMVTFRESQGDKDISGDYYAYDTVNEISVGNTLVTIKGNADKFNLAVWEKDGFSWSLQISVGVSEKEILDMVKNVY